MLIIEKVDDIHKVYDITVEDNHNFYANDILVHNCQEITLKTYPFESMDDKNGDIATCILSAVNLGKIKSHQELESLCDILVRALDSIITLQSYPNKIAERTSKNYRSIGVGYINFAYYLAKKKLPWDSVEAKKEVHELTEAFQYYLLKASNQLAKEQGRCDKFHLSKYADNIFPIDTYKKNLDEVAPFELKMDWDTLRQEVQQYGLRNFTLSTMFPSESSSLVTNATSGIEPPRAALSFKKSKSSVIPILVPESEKLKNSYEYLWDMKSMKPYLSMMGIIQKFIDQSISTNTSYNPLHFENNSVSLNTLIQDIFYAYSLGIKSLYYNNINDMSSEETETEESGCSSGACSL